jgi:formylmethanofuran dehydrogenase subunit E-like metal-binding protein
MKQITLTHVDNQEHGYVKVSKYDLMAWLIDPTPFSKYSYYNVVNGCLYLEEDCDAPILVKELKNRGYEVNFESEHVSQNYFDKKPFKRLAA